MATARRGSGRAALLALARRPDEADAARGLLPVAGREYRGQRELPWAADLRIQGNTPGLAAGPLRPQRLPGYISSGPLAADDGHPCETPDRLVLTVDPA